MLLIKTARDSENNKEIIAPILPATGKSAEIADLLKIKIEQ